MYEGYISLYRIAKQCLTEDILFKMCLIFGKGPSHLEKETSRKKEQQMRSFKVRLSMTCEDQCGKISVLRAIIKSLIV